MHLWEGSVGAPGVLGEQPGVSYGKRDSPKPGNLVAFAQEGFQQDGQSPAALRSCAWQQPVSRGTGSPSARSSSPSSVGPAAPVPAAAARLPWDCCSCCISHAAQRSPNRCWTPVPQAGSAPTEIKSADLLQRPGWEERCCCRAPGSAHPLLESSPPQGQ